MNIINDGIAGSSCCEGSSTKNVRFPFTHVVFLNETTFSYAEHDGIIIKNIDDGFFCATKMDADCGY